MTSSWPHRYVELSPTAQHVLVAMVLLDRQVAEPDQLAAALGVERADAGAAVDELVKLGWFGGEDGSSLDERARIWLRYDAPRAAGVPLVEERVRRDIAGRVIQLHTDNLDDGDGAVRWAADHRTDIVAAIRAGVRTGLYADAVRLAGRAWSVASQVPDSEWWRELAHHGSMAAARNQDHAAYLTLVTLSATALENGGDLLTAEDHWIQALELARLLEDEERVTAVTAALVALYRKAGRQEMVMEVLLDLANANQATGNVHGRAEALIELADLNLEVGRPRWAQIYYERAEGLLRDAAIELAPTRTAHVLEQRGRALWMLSSPVLARRAFRQALDVLADHDPVIAGRLKMLLAVHTDAPALPDP